MPPIPALPPTHSSFGVPTASPYFNPAQRTVKNEDSYDYRLSFDGADGDNNYLPSPTMSTAHAPRKGMPPSSSFAQAPPQTYKNPNPNNIEIRTKFPVARIKRIMQADEEVGKVAQVTPVAVSKALELFMIALVSGAAEKAKEKGGKRVTAQHLKMVVEGDEQFDFLNEIVGKVADVQEGAGGSKRKEKVEGSESEEEKKVKKGKGRRKKGDD
jgi:histone H3/H4